MNIEIKSISSALNKAYLSQSLFVDDLNLFTQNHAALLKAVQHADSEETIKAYVNNFLRDTYYKDKFTIKENVNNIDLVVYNGNSETDTIGVIVETKALKNSAEMITPADLNRKAFREAILYYLEERVTNSNIGVKHIIITNSIDWFIFDAAEFERIFVDSHHGQSLRPAYIEWSAGKLADKGKEWFYTEIAKPFVGNSQETIRCTYFQLSEKSEQTQNSLIEFYKVFSPEHLLKLSFANDSNTLNQDFYNELLHIIGLYETNDKARKIERLKEKDRNEGSFLEGVIAIVERDDILKNIESPEQFGDTAAEQIFSIALELCLSWINRIIFLKLLESQLLKYNDNNTAFLFLTHHKIKDFDEVRELFFDVLAVKPAERKTNLQAKYEHIPYLNSSLFEQTELEKTAVKINHLKHNAEMPVFASTVLNDETGKRQTARRPLLQYLFEFLDSYNFASSAKLEVQETPKTLINSSVLGLIFEKLNGYKEGSFYTPGYITMYMSRETIRNAVIQKFRPVLNIEENVSFSDSWRELYNKIETLPIVQANEIFNTIRICDPSVGSGHFLVSALNELLAIKSELAILADSNGLLLRNVYCEVQNDELFVSHFDQLFTYNFHDRESQRIQETLFHEKRTLIENCLFGVDINPKSVQICRLRLWIELLKNAYYIRETATPRVVQRELETLPNIDINIKCGNSLVSFFDLQGQGFKNGQLSKIQIFTGEYKTQVELYKKVSSKAEKEKIVQHIKALKQRFMEYANPNDKDYQELKRKETEYGTMPMFFSHNDQLQWQQKQTKLFEVITELQTKISEKHKNLYANAFEWRFEFPEVLDDDGNFIGFDVVIGNPPYISAVDMRRTKWQKEYFGTAYPEASGAYDIFILFLKKAAELLKTGGYYSWIIPNKFLAAQYAQRTKDLLANNGLQFSVDISHVKVFEKASVYPIMIFGANKTKKADFRQYKAESETDLLSNNIQEYAKQREYKTFGEVGIKIMSGATGFEAQKLKALISVLPVKGSIPFVVSGCIDRYVIDFENVRYMGTLYPKAFIHNNNKVVADTKWRFWNNEKIVVAGMTKEIEAIWATQPLAIGVGTYGIYDFGGYKPQVLLAILNSTFTTTYITAKFRDKHLAGGYLAITKGMIEQFPIVEIDQKLQEKIAATVDKILAAKCKDKNADTLALQNKIDQWINSIYA